MITYGHEKYIEEAIKGVFLQETDFIIELIIANDCSPDNSDEVIKKIIQNPPENIVVKYTRHESNKGMNANFVWALKQAKGKYIAICEGDDYWTEKNKLQKQTDFLENHPDYVLSFHNVKFLNGENIISETPFDTLQKNTYTIDDLSKKNIIPTLSIVFRNIKLDFPNWFHTAVVGDFPLILMLTKYGKTAYINQKMGIYRENIGVWSGKERDHTKMINLLTELIAYFSDFENKNVTKNLSILRNRYIKLHLKKEKLNHIIKDEYWKALPINDKAISIIRKLL